MAKMKYADGGPTDMGSRNEAMRPSPNPDFQAAMAAERARQAAAMRKDAENIKKSDAAAEARKVREALQESKEAKDRKTFGAAYADASRRTMKKGGSVSSASKRADGCVTKGKTKGKFV